MLKEIEKAVLRFRESENAKPKTISLDYQQGLDLLVESLKAPCVHDRFDIERMLVESLKAQCVMNRFEIEQMLDTGNRRKITERLNNMTVMGMRLTIADITIGHE